MSEAEIQAALKKHESRQCKGRYETEKKLKYQKVSLFGVLTGLLLSIIFLFIIPVIIYIPLAIVLGFIILWYIMGIESCTESED